MPNCPACNAYVDAADRFCTVCGAALPAAGGTAAAGGTPAEPPAAPFGQPATPMAAQPLQPAQPGPAARLLPPPPAPAQWPPQNAMPYPAPTPLPMGWPLPPVAAPGAEPQEVLHLQGQGVWMKGEKDFSNGQFYLTNYRAVFYEVPPSLAAMYGPYGLPAHALPRQSGYLEIPLRDIGAAEVVRHKGSTLVRLRLPGDGAVDFWMEPAAYWAEAVTCAAAPYSGAENAENTSAQPAQPPPLQAQTEQPTGEHAPLIPLQTEEDNQ